MYLGMLHPVAADVRQREPKKKRLLGSHICKPPTLQIHLIESQVLNSIESIRATTIALYRLFMRFQQFVQQTYLAYRSLPVCW